jgi:hypothetical protein
VVQLNNNCKICILKINDDDFMILDEIHKEMYNESIILFFIKKQSIDITSLIKIIVKEKIKILVIPEFIDCGNIAYDILFKNNIKLFSYHDTIEINKKVLLLTNKSILINNKNVYKERINKLDYNFLYRIKNTYPNINYIISTIKISDIYINKINDTLNIPLYNIDILLTKKIKLYLKKRDLLNSSNENGVIEVEEL